MVLFTELDLGRIGRVAAGAIAEKYLTQVYGIEVVAFVSSVGKVTIPSSVDGRAVSHDEENDAIEEALTPEFRQPTTPQNSNARRRRRDSDTVSARGNSRTDDKAHHCPASEG